MADRNVKVVLSLIATGYESGMAKAKAATDSLVTSTKGMDDAQKASAEASRQAAQEAQALAEKRKQAAADVSTAMLTAGGAILAGVGLITKSYADFDKAMSNVQATGVGTGATMDALRDKAIELGATTSFSAVEAAQGIEELAKAGLSATDILDGGLAGALNLAAAGTISVGKAAEITAVTMQQFGLDGGQAAHVADLLAAGANEAVGGVEDIGAALNMAGTVAAQYGISVEETVGSLAMFSSNALIGSDAGTSFKQMLLQLASPTGAAREMLDEYNISAYDAQGNFVGMESLAGQLKTQLGGLSQEQQNAALKTIFGADAIRTATVLMKEGAEGVREWTDKVNQTGYASEMAAIKMNNLSGDMENLGGAFESAFIKSGSGVNDFLRGAVQGLTGFVNLVGSIPGPVLTVGAALAGLAGAGLVGVGGFIKIVQAGAELKSSLETLSDAFPNLGSSMGRMRAAAGAAAAALVALAAVQWAGQSYQQGVDATRASITELGNAATAAARGNMSKLDDAYRQIGGSATNAGIEIAALQRTTGTAADGFLRFANGIVGIKAPTQQVEEQTRRLDQAFAKMSTQQAADAFRNLSVEAVKYGADQTKLINQFPEYRDKLIDQATALNVTNLSAQDLYEWMGGKVPAAVALAASAAGNADPKLKDLAGGMKDTAEASKDAYESLVKIGNAMLSLSGSQMGYEGALHDVTEAIKENGKAHLDAAGNIDISTEKGRALKGSLDQVASSALSVIDGMVKTSAETSKISEFQQRAAIDFLNTAMAMGMGRDKAFALAEQYNLIPKSVVTAVNAPGAVQSDEEARQLTAALIAVPKLTSAQVLAPGARPSKGEVDAFVAAIGNVPGVTEAQIRTLANLYGIDTVRREMSSLKDKDVTITVLTVRKTVEISQSGGSVYRTGAGSKFEADGGILARATHGLTQRFADGGSFQGQQSQIRPAGGTGVTWAEHGAGPWEAFISGHPAKRSRSRWLMELVAARLGGQVMWGTAYADGGMRARYGDAYRPPATSSVTTQIMQPGPLDLSEAALVRLAELIVQGARDTTYTARRAAYMAGRSA